MAEQANLQNISQLGEIIAEGRYRRLLETALEGILFVNSNARITYANPRLASILGYASPDALNGQDVYTLFFPEDVEAARRRWADRFQGVDGQYEVRLRRRDGSVCWVLAQVNIETAADGAFSGTFNLFTDVSDRHKALADLSAKSREVISIMESMTDAFSSFDSEWRFLYANAAAARILGRSADDLIGKCIWDEFPGSRHTIVYSEYLRAVREQTTVAFDLYYPHLHGWFEVRAYPSPSGLAAYFRDITERKIAEQEREMAAEEKARLLKELQSAAERQRRFLREMLYSLTEGRLRLCDGVTELPKQLTEMGEPLDLMTQSIKTLRKSACAIAETLGVPLDRIQDIETGIGEAAMNAVRHAGGGVATVCGDRETGTLQIWIADKGTGISEDSLHRATLEKGYSSAGTLGHGFWLMLKTCDRIYLLTGPAGTTVVLEQERAAPEPVWIRDFDQKVALHLDNPAS